MLTTRTEPLTDRFLRAIVGNVPPDHVAAHLDVPLSRVMTLLARYKLRWSDGRYLHHLSEPEPAVEPEEPDDEPAIRTRVEIMPGRVRFPDGRIFSVRYAEHPAAVRDVHPGPMPAPQPMMSAIGCSLA